MTPVIIVLVSATHPWTLTGDEPKWDLASWGSDHVGQELPNYVTGDECLFCHRNIGITWPENPHQTLMRLADSSQPELRALTRHAPGAAQEADFLLGRDRLVRYLRRSKDYGRLDLLSTRYHHQSGAAGDLSEGHPIESKNVVWQADLFGDRCVGCHATAVDSIQKTFGSTSLDCYVCHGHVDLQHTADQSKVLFSKHPQDALVVNAICSSCHLRGGKSRSTDLPYPNAFLPGDNLFRDFQIDLSDSAVAALPALQQHIYLSAREVGSGRSEPTCVDCHSVHGNHSDPHMELVESGICKSCHVPDTGNSQLIEAIERHDKLTERSATCDY